MILLCLLAIECLFYLYIFALSSFPVGQLEIASIHCLSPLLLVCTQSPPEPGLAFKSCILAWTF